MVTHRRMAWIDSMRPAQSFLWIWPRRMCHRTDSYVNRYKQLKALVLLLILALFSACGFFSCASPATIVIPKQERLFRSEDFAVYQLNGSESSADLAARFLNDRKKAWLIEEANPKNHFRSGEAVVIPLKDLNKGGLSAEGYQTVPILTYHRFADHCSSPLCMPERVFDTQMRYLKENGYHVITPDDLLHFIEYRQRLPKKSVMITMDDGYHSTYAIGYPILEKYGFKATLAIYTSFVGVSRMAVTWEELRKLKAEGYTIASHTISHSDLTQPKKGETEEAFIRRIYQELQGSKEILDNRLQQDTFVVVYPFGRYDKRVMNLAQKAGYKIAMSVKRGGNPFFSNPYSLKRDQVLKRDMQTFISRLKTFENLPLK